MIATLKISTPTAFVVNSFGTEFGYLLINTAVLKILAMDEINSWLVISKSAPLLIERLQQIKGVTTIFRLIVMVICH